MSSVAERVRRQRCSAHAADLRRTITVLCINQFRALTARAAVTAAAQHQSAAMRRITALLLPLCTALAPLRHRTTLKASTQPFVYDNADTLAERYADYEAVCQAACDDDEAFATFKAQAAYQDVLEHVSYDVGRCYEHRLKIDHPSLFEDEGIREAVTLSSKLGSPSTYDYGEWGNVSPTQLRYVCVRGDMENVCGSLADKKVVEIGGGYGGQAQVCLAGEQAAAHYRVLDLRVVQRLCRKYIQKSLPPDRAKRFTTGKRFLRDHDLFQEKFDVFHSNFALSELPRKIQKPYVILGVPRCCGAFTPSTRLVSIF